MMGLPDRNISWYLKPFRYNTQLWRTDWQTTADSQYCSNVLYTTAQSPGKNRSREGKKVVCVSSA